MIVKIVVPREPNTGLHARVGVDEDMDALQRFSILELNCQVWSRIGHFQADNPFA
jgi:hypothetical protein